MGGVSLNFSHGTSPGTQRGEERRNKGAKFHQRQRRPKIVPTRVHIQSKSKYKNKNSVKRKAAVRAGRQSRRRRRRRSESGQRFLPGNLGRERGRERRAPPLRLPPSRAAAFVRRQAWASAEGGRSGVHHETRVEEGTM